MQKPRKLTQLEIQEILSLEDINTRKDYIHSIIIDEFSKNPRGYFVLPTGTGKTFCVSRIIKKINKNDKITHGIVVPTDTLKDSFVRSIEENDLKNVTVNIINSYTMNGNINRTYDCLFIDELHRICGESQYFSSVIKISNCKRILGASATLKKEHHKILQSQGLKYLFELTLQEARLLGITPSVKNYNIPVELTFNEKIKYMEYCNEYDRLLNYVGKVTNNPAGFMFGLSKSKFKSNALCEKYAQDLKIKPGQLVGIGLKWFRTMKARNNILINSQGLRDAIVDLCQRLNKKTIIFCGNIETINAICERVPNSIPYHSKLTDSKQKSNLLEFEQNKEKLFIITASKLDEGYDNKELTYGGNIGYNSSEIKSNQIEGRASRYDANNPDKLGMIFNFYVNDFTFGKFFYSSQQLVWLKNSQKGKVNVYWANDINEVLNESNLY